MTVSVTLRPLLPNISSVPCFLSVSLQNLWSKKSREKLVWIRLSRDVRYVKTEYTNSVRLISMLLVTFRLIKFRCHSCRKSSAFLNFFPFRAWEFVSLVKESFVTSSTIILNPGPEFSKIMRRVKSSVNTPVSSFVYDFFRFLISLNKLLLCLSFQVCTTSPLVSGFLESRRVKSHFTSRN
uniref:tRNA-specific 2-thiouridylase MnmA n=1 Tax=Schistocephalus solidus TaxID=70667 RepID=A0A0X3QDC1_SCHSO